MTSPVGYILVVGIGGTGDCSAVWVIVAGRRSCLDCLMGLRSLDMGSLW